MIAQQMGGREKAAGQDIVCAVEQSEKIGRLPHPASSRQNIIQQHDYGHALTVEKRADRGKTVILELQISNERSTSFIMRYSVLDIAPITPFHDSQG